MKTSYFENEGGYDTTGKLLAEYPPWGSTNHPPTLADTICLSFMGSTNYPPTLVDKVYLSRSGSTNHSPILANLICLSRSGSSMVPSTTTTTYYLHDHSGRLLVEYDQSGNCKKDYVYMGNRLVAEYQPTGSKYYYYTSDQINSTRMITDSSGAVVYSAVFDPYGGMQKHWVNTYSPSLKFSGKERESSSDYDYFGARYYGHKQYRFISVDPVINKDEALVNPQLWNLYAYCRNNPVTYLDPDGRTELKFFIKQGILEIDPQQKGRAPYRISASSGEKEGLNNPDMIGVKDKGPIPVGEYEINTKELSDPGFIRDIIRNELGDWGDWRVPIKPKSGTNTYDRDEFLLHGGGVKGSRGCIDIGGGRFGDKTTDLVKKDIMNDPNNRVPLKVVRGDDK